MPQPLGHRTRVHRQLLRRRHRRRQQSHRHNPRPMAIPRRQNQMVPTISSTTRRRNPRKNTCTRTCTRPTRPRTNPHRHRNHTLISTRQLQRNTNQRTSRTQLRTHRTLHRNGNQSHPQHPQQPITPQKQRKHHQSCPKAAFFNAQNQKTQNFNTYYDNAALYLERTEIRKLGTHNCRACHARSLACSPYGNGAEICINGVCPGVTYVTQRNY